MSTARPTRFDEVACELDAAVGTVRQRLEGSGVEIADWSNRGPHYDPLRSVSFTFTKTQSVAGEQQRVTVSIFVLEPTSAGEAPVITVATKAERFCVGKPSHWESSHEEPLTAGDFFETDLDTLVRQRITDGQTEIMRST